MESVEVPAHQLTYRCEKGITVTNTIIDNEKKVSLEPSQTHKFETEITNFYYSPNGQNIAFACLGEIHIVSSQELSREVSVIKYESAKNFEEVQFSPLGNFLVTWVQPEKSNDPQNLCIWEVESGNKLGGWTMKNKFSWPLIQFSQDESIMGALLQKGKISFYKSPNFSAQSEVSLSIAGSTQFFVSPSKIPFIAAFVPFKASEPGYIQVYKYPKFDVPLIKKAFFGDSVEASWNKDGNAMLITINQDVNKDNYYGKKTLQYINVQTKFDRSVTENFVHDAQWSPNGKEFALIHGNMPTPKTIIYDLMGVPKVDLMVGVARNKLMFDPTGRILMIGGFGSLNGEMDFWDISKPDFVKLGHVQAFSSSFQAWSPDGKYFLACVQSPRMKVDNDIKIFNIYGMLLFEEKRKDLYQAEWRSLPLNLFPLQQINAKKVESQQQGPAKYRHPNFSASKVPIGGKPAASTSATPVRYNPNGSVVKQQIGGQLKAGTQPNPNPNANKPKKKKQPNTQAKPVVIEEIEQPTF
jgi:translation initiation factor 2A